MNVRLRTGWFSLGVFLFSLAVLVPVLSSVYPPAVDDVIAEGVGDTIQAKLARNVASLYYDDSFYYLQIARHAAAGSGSTFDGSNPTNGYHPLWLLCLIPLARWLQTAESLLLASFGLQALAAAVTSVFVYRIARLGLGRAPALCAAAVWIRVQVTYWMSWAGMEYGVQALASTGLVYVYLRRRKEPDSRWLLGLGLIASLAFLARLDNLLLALLIGLALACRGDLQSRWRGLAFYAGPLALTVAAYVGVGIWLFDSAWPISAELKRDWSRELLASDPIFSSYGWLGAKMVYLLSPLSSLTRSFSASLLLGAFGGGVITLLAATRRQAMSWHLELWPLGSFALLQYVAYAAAYHGGHSFQPWYYVAQPLLTALLAAAAIEAVSKHAITTSAFRRLGPCTNWTSWTSSLLLVVIMLSTAVLVERRRERQSKYLDEPLYVAAGWARAHVPLDANIGAWNAGTLAFFSDRRIINLDGLVNSRSFFSAHRHDLCSYFEREEITYLLDVFEISEPFAQHGKQLQGCVSRLKQVWVGRQYPSSGRRAAAYRVLPESSAGGSP